MNAVIEPLENTGEQEHDLSLTSADALRVDQSVVASLVVLTGSQQGATANIRAGEMLSIGRSSENDIVLRDPTIEPVHMMLRVESGTTFIDVLGANVLMDGAGLTVGERTSCAGTAQLQLGDVTLGINPLQPSAIQPLMSVGSDAPTDDIQSAQTSVPPPSTGRGSIGKMPMLVGASLLLGAAAVWQSDWMQVPVVKPVALEVMLAESAFRGLSVQRLGDRVWLAGFLPTISEATQLDNWLAQNGIVIENKVLVGEALASQVSDVFRVSGVSASVQVDANGVANVETRVADASVLDRIEKLVLADVPGITEVNINNTPPVEKIKPTTVEIDPGKRVAMVVFDEPAHSVTEDQSRYFVGALLPNGRRIVEIKDGMVTVEFEGKLSKMEF